MNHRRVVLTWVTALALSACAGVLGIRPAPAHPFEHRAHVNRGINCLTCHSGVMSAETSTGVHFPATADCTRCHTTPHDTRSCDGCHGESYIRAGAELAQKHLKFEHRAHMPAVKGECVPCHLDVGLEQPGVLRPRMATCFGCHQHEKQWAVRDCDGCHVDIASEPDPPSTHLVHAGDWMREHGVRAASARELCAACHSERSCAACHGANVPALPARLAFDRPAMSGLHRGGFRSRHAEEARASPGICVSCHSERSCMDCHAIAQVAPGTAVRSPHPSGWLSSARGGGQHGTQARIDPVSCAGCHGGAGEQLCVGCHRVGGPGGNPHGAGFSSSKDMRRELPCRLCHGGR